MRTRKERMVVARNYISVVAPEHPKASGGRVYEHVLVAERALGKPLPPKAEVHHVDANGQNNRRNLVICPNRAYHMLLHQRIRARKATGNPNSRKCPYCKLWSLPEHMLPQRRKGRSVRYVHPGCRAPISAPIAAMERAHE